MARSATGGGPIPVVNDTLEQVLDALAPSLSSETDPLLSAEESQEDSQSPNGLSQDSGNMQQQPQLCNSTAGRDSTSTHINNSCNNIGLSTNDSASVNPASKASTKASRGNSINNSSVNFSSGSQQQQQPATPRATRIRGLEIEEELLVLERQKVEIMRDNLVVQRGILECLESLSTSAIFTSVLR